MINEVDEGGGDANLFILKRDAECCWSYWSWVDVELLMMMKGVKKISQLLIEYRVK